MSSDLGKKIESIGQANIPKSQSSIFFKVPIFDFFNDIWAESDINISLYVQRLKGLAFIVNKKQKRFTSWGKLMMEFQFYDQLDPGAKNKKKLRYESRNIWF